MKKGFLLNQEPGALQNANTTNLHCFQRTPRIGVMTRAPLMCAVETVAFLPLRAVAAAEAALLVQKTITTFTLAVNLFASSAQSVGEFRFR